MYICILKLIRVSHQYFKIEKVGEIYPNYMIFVTMLIPMY